MNSCNFVGTISNEPRLIEKENRKMVFFSLGVRSPFDFKRINYLPFVAFDKQAEKICNNCKKDSQIGLSCEAQSKTVEINGYKQALTTFVVNTIDLTILNKQNTTEYQDTKTDLNEEEMPF